MSAWHRFMILKYLGSFIQKQTVSFMMHYNLTTSEKKKKKRVHRLQQCERSPWLKQSEEPLT